MKRQVSKSDFKPKVFEYLRQVTETGKELIITDHGEPVVKVVPISKSEMDPLGSLRGLLERYEDPFLPVGEDWEAQS